MPISSCVLAWSLCSVMQRKTEGNVAGLVEHEQDVQVVLEIDTKAPITLKTG